MKPSELRPGTRVRNSERPSAPSKNDSALAVAEQLGPEARAKVEQLIARLGDAGFLADQVVELFEAGEPNAMHLAAVLQREVSGAFKQAASILETTEHSA